MISSGGRFVAFQSDSENLVWPDTNETTDIFLKDLLTGDLTLVSKAFGSLDSSEKGSADACLSGDGRYVSFRSRSSNLVLGDSNDKIDVFRFDSWTGNMLRVSNAIAGESNGDSFAPSISGDGSRIAFTSHADNLTIGDTNGKQDIFIVDVGGLPTLVTRNEFGLSANHLSNLPALSADGEHVAFISLANDLVGPLNNATQVLVCHLNSMEMELVSVDPLGQPSNDYSLSPSISAHGRFIAFLESSNGMAPYESIHEDVLVRDMQLGQTWTGSRPSGVSGIANGASSFHALSEDGSTLVFASEATNMVPGDANVHHDVFLRAMHPNPTSYCASSTTSAGCVPNLSTSGYPSSSADVGFTMFASNVPNQRTGFVFYGFDGPAETPFHGATLCVEFGLRRGPVLHSGGSAVGSDCSGTFALDLNAYASGSLGGTPNIGLSLIGQQVNVQVFGRDAGNVFLSNAIQYIVGP